MTDELLINVLEKLQVKNLRETNDSFIFSCPLAEYFHYKGTDNHPSCQIRKEDGKYYCYSCKNFGPLWDLVDTIKFLNKREDLNELLEGLRKPQKFIINTKRKEQKKDQIFLPDELIERYPKATDETKSLEYVFKRGIDSRLANKYNLRYDSDRNRLLFPIYDNKYFVGFQGRAIEQDEKRYYNYFNVNKSLYLGGSNHLTLNKIVIVVEGFISLLKLKHLIPEFNIVTTFGSSISDEQAIKLINLDKLIISCFDNDKAGSDGRIIFNEKLKFNRFKTRNLVLPEDIDTISKETLENNLFKLLKL